MKNYDYKETFFPFDISAINTWMGEEQYISENCSREELFHQFLNRKMAENGVSVPELMRKSCVNKNYGYNILNGARRKPGRDKVIALCIAAKMTLGEVQHALIISQDGILYWRNERDMRIAFAINAGINDVMQLNIILSEKGKAPLEA